MKKVDWLCCQYGGREYYAVPRAIIKNDTSAGLITDLWINPDTWVSRVANFPINRYHPGLNKEPVKSFNSWFFIRKVINRLSNNSEDHNGRRFEKLAATWIKRNSVKLEPEVVFSYSYEALEIFKVARSIGAITVSGQINPGPLESEIVEEAFQEEFGKKYKPSVPGQIYWDRWYRECELADHIVVNSRWSEKLIEKAGIPADKISVIPLVYDVPKNHDFRKSYPKTFSRERPLRILYLGSISVRKGFHLLKKAMKELTLQPVTLELAGRLIGPEELIRDLPPNIIFHGYRGQEEKNQLYRNADVFILPTLSDGFAITQLEAQYWKLPLIASARCGEIVTDRTNGITLDKLSPGSIRDAILNILDQPFILNQFSENSVSMNNYSLKAIGQQWMNVVK